VSTVDQRVKLGNGIHIEFGLKDMNLSTVVRFNGGEHGSIAPCDIYLYMLGFKR
jgi:hypothetical protein